MIYGIAWMGSAKGLWLIDLDTESGSISFSEESGGWFVSMEERGMVDEDGRIRSLGGCYGIVGVFSLGRAFYCSK